MTFEGQKGLEGVPRSRDPLEAPLHEPRLRGSSLKADGPGEAAARRLQEPVQPGA